MAADQQIKVLIADRDYPLKVSEEELDSVLTAEKEIAAKLKTLRASYQVKEKQDLLAMCLLQVVVEKNKGNNTETDNNGSVYDKIADLESFVSEYLKK